TLPTTKEDWMRWADGHLGQRIELKNDRTLVLSYHVCEIVCTVAALARAVSREREWNSMTRARLD
ncbi:MAG TPA: hypothetical protein VM537_11285, partial [Anaerolineae bacterium]|nr:hypothetical protein [Anaerolineae bacterium]